MRRHYFERAVVTTAPTPRGRLEIDGDHPYFGIHTLAGKGIKDFSVFLVRAGGYCVYALPCPRRTLIVFSPAV
jgi:hypothetical protein